MSTNDLEKVLRALRFAADKHRNQRRKDVQQSPYINHPIDLATILAVDGRLKDPVVICAAILHDTLEDTETTPQEIENLFGTEVMNVVLEVTDDKRLPWRERKRLQVEQAALASHAARLVKLADKIANLRDMAAAPPAQWSLTRVREYFDWAWDVVNNLRGTHRGLEAAFDQAYNKKP